MTTYLQRINYRPSEADLNEKDVQYLRQHFDAYGADIVVNGNALPWEAIEEVEVAVAARAVGPSGWLVKKLIMGGDRYHVAVYFGREELVVTNVTRDVARYIVENVAYYASQPVRYTGPDDFVPTIEQGDQ